MAETPSSTTVSTKLERIAKLAREMPQVALTTLAHHIDIDWLREAYRRTRKEGATGVDGQTADEYASKLEENLCSLLDVFSRVGVAAQPKIDRSIHETRSAVPTRTARKLPLRFGFCASTPGLVDTRRRRSLGWKSRAVKSTCNRMIMIQIDVRCPYA